MTDKDNLNKIALEWFARDMRPLKVTEGSGFLLLADALIKIGHKYGDKINSKDLFIIYLLFYFIKDLYINCRLPEFT